MDVIIPVTVTDFVLESSSVPETDYDMWDAGTSYSVGQRCIRTTTHKIYEAVTGGVDSTPPEDALGGDTPKWLDLGATNRWAMFDDEVGSTTTSTTTLDVKLRPGRIAGLALMELVGSQATVTVYDEDGGSTIYTRTQSLDGAIITSFFDWFFETFRQKSEIVFVDIPNYFPDCVVAISVISMGAVSCGVCKIGNVIHLGGTQYGMSYGLTDYSRKERNEWGRYVLVPRSWSKKISARLIFESAELARVMQTFADLRTTPSVWISSPESGFEPLTVFGFAADFSIEIQYQSHYYCSLEIEGLI